MSWVWWFGSLVGFTNPAPPKKPWKDYSPVKTRVSHGVQNVRNGFRPSWFGGLVASSKRAAPPKKKNRKKTDTPMVWWFGGFPTLEDEFLRLVDRRSGDERMVPGPAAVAPALEAAPSE